MVILGGSPVFQLSGFGHCAAPEVGPVRPKARIKGLVIGCSSKNQ